MAKIAVTFPYMNSVTDEANEMIIPCGNKTVLTRHYYRTKKKITVQSEKKRMDVVLHLEKRHCLQEVSVRTLKK